VQLILKESTIDAVRDNIFGDPLSHIISTLSSDLSHFSHFSKIHLYPLSLVVSLGDISAVMVQSAVTWCKARAIL